MKRWFLSQITEKNNFSSILIINNAFITCIKNTNKLRFCDYGRNKINSKAVQQYHKNLPKVSYIMDDLITIGTEAISQ